MSGYRKLDLTAQIKLPTMSIGGIDWVYRGYEIDCFEKTRYPIIGFDHVLSKNDEIVIACDVIHQKTLDRFVQSFKDTNILTKIRDFALNSKIEDTDVFKITHVNTTIKEKSTGVFQKTDPMVWYTNEQSYLLESLTYNIERKLGPKDPILTGESPTKKTKSTDKTEEENTDTASVECARPHSTEFNLPEDILRHDTAQFASVLTEQSKCLLYFVTDSSIAEDAHYQTDMIHFLKDAFKTSFNYGMDINKWTRIQIPQTSELLDHAYSGKHLYVYNDPKVYFRSLLEQRYWWAMCVQTKLTSQKECQLFRYFVEDSHKYIERFVFDFRAHEDGASIPIIFRKESVVCVTKVDTTVKPLRSDNFKITVQNKHQLFNTIKSNQQDTFNLVDITKPELLQTVRVLFPYITQRHFKPLEPYSRCITFKRKKCIFGEKCSLTVGNLILETVFDKKDNTNIEQPNNQSYFLDDDDEIDEEKVTCKIWYSCQCRELLPEGDRNRRKFIGNITRFKNDVKTVVPPVSKDEDISFPEHLDIEWVIEKTDFGLATLFSEIYKDRIVYFNDKFHYFDGEVWNCDTKDNFIKFIIAGKMSAVFDVYTTTLETRISRERAAPKVNKPLLASLNQKIKDAHLLQKKLTDNRSASKEFIKTLLEEKNFADKLLHPGKLAASNGLVDLRTMRIRPFRSTDFIPEKCKFAFFPCQCKPGTCMDRDENGDIKCDSIAAASMQKVDNIIREIMGTDVINPKTNKLEFGDVLYNHFKKFIGYSICGDADMKYFLQLYSPSNSGKSLLLNAIFDVMPTYFTIIPRDTLFGKKQAGRPTPELVILFDRYTGVCKRTGACIEVDADAQLDDRIMKALVGRDKLPSRGMCKEYEVVSFKFVPMFATNFNASIGVLDEALWDRLMMILFPVKFVRGKPTTFTEKTRNEGLIQLFETNEFKVGYFNWLARSSSYYYQHKEDPIPKIILDSIQSLRNESFTLDEFIANSGCYTFDENSKVVLTDLFEDFKRFVKDNEIKSKKNMSLIQFREMIKILEKSPDYRHSISLLCPTNKIAKVDDGGDGEGDGGGDGGGDGSSGKNDEIDLDAEPTLKKVKTRAPLNTSTNDIVQEIVDKYYIKGIRKVDGQHSHVQHTLSNNFYMDNTMNIMSSNTNQTEKEKMEKIVKDKIAKEKIVNDKIVKDKIVKDKIAKEIGNEVELGENADKDIQKDTTKVHYKKGIFINNKKKKRDREDIDFNNSDLLIQNMDLLDKFGN